MRGRMARSPAAGRDESDAVLRVLILDDESIVVDTLAACLRLPGVELTTCMEIEAAEALLRCFRFDVVITDLSVSQLGGLDGMRLVRFVTANFPDTAVYVLSGYVDPAVRDLCSGLGVPAAQKELLFEADMICIRAALTEVVHLGNSIATFLNVQPRSLTNPEFAARLCDAVHSAGFSEKDIVLELTEQQTIVNPSAFAATLQ